MMKLEYKANMVIAKLSDIRWTLFKNISITQNHVAGAGGVEGAEHMQERALAYARRTRERYEISGIDGHIKAAKDWDLMAVEKIALFEAAHFDFHDLFVPQSFDWPKSGGK